MKVRDKTLLVFCITVIVLITLSVLILVFAYKFGFALDLLTSLYMIFGFGLLFGIIMLGVLDHLILARVGILTGAVNEIGVSRSIAGRVVLPGNDEIACLAHSINGMLEQLEVAEDRVKQSEQRYHAIIQDQTEFIARFLPDGTHVFANDAYCRYYGRPCSAIIGRKFVPNIPEEDRKKVQEHFRSFTPDKKVLTIEHRLVMPDGELRWQHWTDRAIFGDDGTIREFQSVGRDITSHKRAEQAIRRANEKLNILGEVTRHDILNLIQVLRSYQDLSVDLNRDIVIGDYLRKAAGMSLRIQKLVEFSRDYQNMGVRDPCWHRFEQMVLDTGSHFPMIRVGVDAGGLEIYADPLLEKVFYNLMDNSVRHGGHATAAHVYHARSDDGLTIVYEDNGQGIAYIEKPRIFQHGYGKNTGYGLFLIHEILALTGMTIEENGEPGKGARFEIHVPRGNYRFPPLEEPAGTSHASQEAGALP